jgi:hypothetical protein
LAKPENSSAGLDIARPVYQAERTTSSAPRSRKLNTSSPDSMPSLPRPDEPPNARLVSGNARKNPARRR